MDSFSPTWRELLHPVRLPIKATTPAPSKYNNYDPKPEPPSYVHLGVRILEPTEDFEEKLRMVLENEFLYHNFDSNKQPIDEFHLRQICESNIDINLLPDNDTALTNEKLRQNKTECLEKVLQKIPSKELAEHGIIIQTYRIETDEFDKSYYQKRVSEVVTEFLNKTVIYNNYIRNDNIMQVFLYEGYLYQPGRLFTKFSTDRSRDHIEEILKDFIEKFHEQNEVQQLVELIYLEHYNLSPTIYLVLKSSLKESLSRRPFFKDVNTFMGSPIYISATHGLQRLCRKMILMSMLKCHAKFLVLQLRHVLPLTAKEEGRICDIFLQTCVSVLMLPKLEDW